MGGTKKETEKNEEKERLERMAKKEMKNIKTMSKEEIDAEIKKLNEEAAAKKLELEKQKADKIAAIKAAMKKKAVEEHDREIAENIRARKIETHLKACLGGSVLVALKDELKDVDGAFYIPVDFLKNSLKTDYDRTCFSMLIGKTDGKKIVYPSKPSKKNNSKKNKKEAAAEQPELGVNENY
jgi:hypothetical protein